VVHELEPKLIKGKVVSVHALSVDRESGYNSTCTSPEHLMVVSNHSGHSTHR